MAQGFDQQDTSVTVAISQLRNMAYTRLNAAQRRRDPSSASAAFQQAQGSNDSLIGGLLLSLLTWTPMLDGFGEAMGEAGQHASFDAHMVGAFIDGASLLWDEKAYKNRERKDGIYHGGRRQDKIIAPSDSKMSKKFNLVSANENSRFSFDVEAEIAGMHEILDMLDTLEKRGVSMMRIERKESVSATLKRATRRQAPFAAMTRHAVPMRMAV